MNNLPPKTDEAVPCPYSVRAEIVLICLLFVASLFVHLWFLYPSPFDGLYGQDSYAYFDFAGELRTAISQGRAPGAFFWPLGYPVLLAVGFALFGTQAVVGQAINIILGTALTPLVYILARQIGLKRTGSLIAALLMTLCGQALQSSLVLMSDIPGLFWTALSAVLLWAYLQSSHKTRWLVLAGIALALACITRWIYLILAPLWAICLLIEWRGHIRWRDSLVTLLGVTVIILPQVLYSTTNPWPTLNHAWVEGWSPGNAFKSEFTNIDGHFQYDKINAVYYAQTYYDPYYLAPIFAPFLLLALWGLFRRGYAQLLMIAAWALLPYLFLAGIPYQNIRFPLIVVPAVAILAGVGMETAAEWVSHIRLPRSSPAAVGALAVLLIIGASQMLPIDRTNVGNFIINQQRDKDTAAWAAQHVPDGATLYTFGRTRMLKHYTTLHVYELYYETPDTLAEKWNIGKDDYLLINVWNIENQWVGRDPQNDYHWLRDRRGLIELGKYGYFTLFKIKG
jgi:4-amino-4-deoxy-L-arabinose transferase-like glycosyltransferase